MRLFTEHVIRGGCTWIRSSSVLCPRAAVSFSAPDAIKYRGLTADRLREIGVDIVDIDDINDEGLLFDDSHIEPIVKKFRAEGVDGIVLCHANFGT